jgi:hypothetical protein
MAMPFSSLPAHFRHGLLLILKSDVGGQFTDAQLAGFRSRAEALPASQLVLRSPTALLYRFQIPGRSPASTQ